MFLKYMFSIKYFSQQVTKISQTLFLNERLQFLQHQMSVNAAALKLQFSSSVQNKPEQVDLWPRVMMLEPFLPPDVWLHKMLCPVKLWDPECNTLQDWDIRSSNKSNQQLIENLWRFLKRQFTKSHYKLHSVSVMTHLLMKIMWYD